MWALFGCDAHLLWVSFVGWVRWMQAGVMAEGTSSPLQASAPGRVITHGSAGEMEITTPLGAARGYFGLRQMSSGESLWACARHVFAPSENKLGGFLLSPLFCKPWDTAQRPRGVRAPQLEALCPHGWVLARSGRLRAGRDAGELSGSCAGCGCSPGTRRIPLPGAGSGIGLGYYSNGAFLLN